MRLVPRGGADRIDGVTDGVLKARVAAPPVDGAANDALIRLIADALDVRASHVHLLAGASNRRKLIEIDGLDADVVRSRWQGLDV